MTLQLALKAADGLVLASDGRGSFGHPAFGPQIDAQAKIHFLGSHVAVACAGASELALSILREYRHGVTTSEPDGATTAMTRLRTTARACFADWFGPQQMNSPIGHVGGGRPDVIFTMAGYDQSPKGGYTSREIFQLYSSLDFAPMTIQDGFAVSGVSQFALYLLNRLYVQDRPIRQVMPLAVLALTETASQEARVGGPLTVTLITPEPGCQNISSTTVAKVACENNMKIESLRQSFYAGDDSVDQNEALIERQLLR